MKVNTSQPKIQNILERSVENVFTKELLEKKLLSGKKLRVYLGIDPTGPTLHIGHAIQLQKLKEFQELGHEAILLMGDFTAMIGDPTDKTSARVPLTHKQVLNNLKKYKKQASTFLDFTGPNKAKFLFNSKWLSKMNFEDVLNLASKMTVDQMLKRDMFARRQEEGKPIFIHEFMYPLMQGYDSVAMKVDVEVGGNDQTFNMLAGRHLAQEILNKDKSVVATKLLVDNSGKKMGKTEGNMITFEDNASNMFGKVMSWSDELIIKGFELCTNVLMSEVSNFEQQIKSGANPKDFKMRLAYEIAKTYHGVKKAEKAKLDFINKFQKKETPEEVNEIKATGRFLDTVVRSGCAKSISDVRRLIEAGAITDMTEDRKVGLKDEEKIGHIYKIGKHRFIKIV